jgi:hypothetical protein
VVTGPVVIEDPERQQLLESACASGAARGEAVNWELRLGTHRLLLEPGLGVWLFLNVLEDEWIDTGVRVGEVTFRVVDGRLGYKRTAA